LTGTRIVLVAKAPIPGFAKTRLAPVLGDDGAARLARLLFVRVLREACASGVGNVEIYATPSRADPAWATLSCPPDVHWSEQPKGDLGVRLASVARRVAEAGERVLLAGTDCPALDAGTFRLAAASLDRSDAVMLPTFDGGYALLGLRRFSAAVFDSIPWSTPAVADATRERLHGLGWRLDVGPLVHDIDEPGDLRWLPYGWIGGGADPGT
jgi:rSAM/selenodomain-associated transferase 1